MARYVKSTNDDITSFSKDQELIQIRKHYAMAIRCEFYLLVLKTIFYSLAALIGRMLFSQLEDKINIFRV